MSIKKKILYVFLGIISIFGTTYFFLGEKHPYIVLIISLAVVAKLKVITTVSLIGGKLYLFLAASKGKIFVFIKKMTFFKGASLAIKRFIIDNVLSKWLDKHIISHIREPIAHFFEYYKSLDWKSKIKKSILVIVPASVISVGLYLGGFIQSIAIYAQLKAIVIGFFKILWVFLSKIISSIIYFFTNFIAGTWLAPIIEIFALSWLLSIIEKIPYIGPPISKFFNFIGKGFNYIFSNTVNIFNKYFGNYLSGYVGNYGEKFGNYLSKKVNSTKEKNELFIIDTFQKKFIDKNIQEYFKGVDTNTDKISFYKNVNKKTKDNIDIKAFFDLGTNLTPVSDLLVIESFASNDKTGNTYNDSEIKRSSFWLLNLNKKPFFIISKNNLFKPIFLTTNSLKVVHPTTLEYDINDIYIMDLDYRSVSLIGVHPDIQRIIILEE